MTGTRGLIAITALCLCISACHKKQAAVTPPPAPAAAAPAAAPVRTARPAPPAPSAPAPVAQANKPMYPDAATRKRIQDLLARIQDAYFDYDKSFLRPDAQKTLLADAQELREILRDYPNYKLTVEGHCDERGSAEYNMALGDARAKAAKEYMVALGIPADQLETVSYGKERPVCDAHEESCWQKNRRAHIVALAK